MIRVSCFFVFLLSICYGDDYGFPDPYPEVYESIDTLPTNLHGWNLPSALEPLIEEGDIKTIVEVGAWTGKSTIFLANILPEGGTIFAVDHWLGSSEHRDPGNRTEYNLVPILFKQFISNVIHAGFQDKIIPVRLASVEAAKKFKELKIKPDVIYIDAAHDYNSVLSDISAWYPLLRKEGLFCGDDWNLGGPEGEVAKAVTAFASTHRLRVCHEGEFWWYEKLAWYETDRK